METTAVKQKVNSINLMRVLCSYMIVALHSHVFIEYNSNLNFIFGYVIPRIAVPFFFAISGYFFTASLAKNKPVTMKYLKRMLFSYTLWSIIYFSMQFLLAIIYNAPVGPLIKPMIINYFFFGSWYHFWYFPAIIFCVCITSLFNRFKKLKHLAIISIFLYIIGVLGSAHYYLGIQIPVLNQLYTLSKFNAIRRVFLTGLPFFMVGYFLNQAKAFISKLNNKTSIFVLILLIIGFIAEIAIIRVLNLQTHLVRTFFLYPLTGWILIVCFKNPMPSLGRFTEQFKYIGGLTYYWHPMIIAILGSTLPSLTGLTISETYIFIITCIITTLSALICYKLNNKWINKLI